MTWFEGTRYLFFGKLCLSVYVLAGAWCSLGTHVSISPPYIDLHIGWLIISLMSRERGLELREAEEEQEAINDIYIGGSDQITG